MPTAAAPAAATAEAAPFRFFELHVLRSRRLGPSMIRITFGGEQLKGFFAGGRDQSLSLFLPQPGQDAPLVPHEEGDAWFARWREMDPEVRGVMRSYTVSAQRREPDELDIEFVLHGSTETGGPVAAGPASRWAERARRGDRVIILGPAVEDNTAVRCRPPRGTDWVLIAADETALPAAAAILEWLPPGMPAKVWIEVPHEADRRELPTRADAEITWLVRDPASGAGAPPGAAEQAATAAVTAVTARETVEAVREAPLPPGTPYAWIAGESGTVRALRRHLVRERGFDRKAVTFVGYWRRGASEEDLRREALSGTATDD
ncbi:siderophore-interacting protein [Streptomyces sp. NPDC047108]|uniref:siderophore-interacting protein n=1 Tax=Streptomyces sp. NPDC047108 TaxID=3155025 RepID=UPI0033C45A16